VLLAFHRKIDKIIEDRGMQKLKHGEPLAKDRLQIAAKVRELRRSRKWTQAELSRRLRLSQNRLSEIERGAGSFTAEQFLLLLKLFNVAASHFVSEPGAPDLRIQNALARLGALHLQESVHVLPSEQLEDVHDVVREALVAGSPRTLTALAPVLVRNADRLNLPRLFAELEKHGLERRLAWVVENTLAALARLPGGSGSESKDWTKIDRRAEASLRGLLEFLIARDRHRDRLEPVVLTVPPDVLDATIRSKRTLDEVRSSASKISQRWGIVTSLQPEDFLQALKAARAGH
jgi:transcriptional regulator with XRE-family HTH domain